MQSSDCDHKNLSATIGTTSDAPQNEGRYRADSTHPGTHTGTLAHTVSLVRVLLGFLADRSTTAVAAITGMWPWTSAGDDLEQQTADEAETAAGHDRFIGRSQPTPEYGNRFGVGTTYYGTTDDGQPLVSSRGAEQQARANAHDWPNDTRRAATDADACGGLATLDGRLPDGQYRDLDEMGNDLTPVRGTDIEETKMSLAQQTESQAMSDGIERDYEIVQAAPMSSVCTPGTDGAAGAASDDGPFLLGKASQLAMWDDEYARHRPTLDHIPGDPSLEMRRDSEMRVIERASDTESKTDAAVTDTDTTPSSVDSVDSFPVMDYDVGGVPKQQWADERGGERWVYPDASWIPDWWKAQEHVERVGATDFEATDDEHDAGFPDLQSEAASESSTDADSASESAAARPPQSAVTADGGEPVPDASATDAAVRDPSPAAQEPEPTPCPTCGTEMTHEIITEYGTRNETTVYEGWWCPECGQGHQHCHECSELHHPDYECAPKRELRVQWERARFGVPDVAIEDVNGDWTTVNVENGCPTCGSDSTVTLHRDDTLSDLDGPEWRPMGEMCNQYDDCDYRR